MPRTTVCRIRLFSDVVLPLTSVGGGSYANGRMRAFQNNRSHPPPTHACCEAVAAERAGGERGFLFAARKAENRVPPSSKAASSTVAATLRRPLNAGRANVKKLYGRLSLPQTPQRGAGESAGAFPRGARSDPGEGFRQETRGAGHGLPCRKAPIKRLDAAEQLRIGAAKQKPAVRP